MEDIDKALDVLIKEIERLRVRQSVSKKAIEAVQQIHSVLFGFGIYDPATAQDSEIARMLWPHLETLKKEFKIEK